MTTNQELRKLAEAATPGPWKLQSKQNYCEEYDCYLEPLGIYIPEGLRDQDAEYLAAANPAKVIELLDRIDRLEAENEAQRKLLERAVNGIDECWVESIEGAAWKEEVTQHLKGTP